MCYQRSEKIIDNLIEILDKEGPMKCPDLSYLLRVNYHKDKSTEQLCGLIRYHGKGRIAKHPVERYVNAIKRRYTYYYYLPNDKRIEKIKEKQNKTPPTYLKYSRRILLEQFDDEW